MSAFAEADRENDSPGFPSHSEIDLRAECRKAFPIMILTRFTEDRLAGLYRAGRIKGGVYLGRGHEAISCVLGTALRPGDIYAPTIRDQAGRLAFGDTVLEAMRSYFGSRYGMMRGRDGNIHRGRPREGYLAMISHLGSMISVVNGALMARRFKGQTGMVGATTLGDGATSTGAFHEGLNQAAVEKLPLVLVVVNNQYAYSTPNTRQFACRSLADKAVGYGIEGVEVDGTDLRSCVQGVFQAVHRARSGEGPQLVVATLLRLCGHGEHDDAHYIDPALKGSPIGKDSVAVAEEILLKSGWATPEEITQWKAQAREIVEQATQQATQEPSPDPYKQVWKAYATDRLADTFSPQT